MLYFVLLVAILLLFGVALYFGMKKRESDEQNAALQQELEVVREELIGNITQLERKLKTLEKLSHIPDVIEKAKRTKFEAELRIEQARLTADEIVRRGAAEAEAKLAEARAEIEPIIAAAKADASKIRATVNEKKAQAEQRLSEAISEAAEILRDADRKAKQIAGDAYDVLQRKQFYERVATAMNNIVKGYGNSYMRPVESALDEWAEQYSFNQAGEKLRLARERSRLLETKRLAADCGYAEASRREFAINFVLDAFNGKVDSILSRVKNDNFGKLEQEIRDAYAIVNQNGHAFREARISDQYLDSRLNELKWASVVQGLRLKEREEQRAIQEQIRDEQRAKKEIERALKQAEKDEANINQALEKARLQYEAAGSAERAKFEAKITELSQKLSEAEERKRQMSMAQQTKTGHVYVISNVGSFGEEVFKIGLTRRLDPLERVKELGDASVPFPFDVHALIHSVDAPNLEYTLHKQFLLAQVNKANPRKEFFRVSLSEIRKVVEAMKLDAKWTLAAEARDYRETQALEKRLNDDPTFKIKWLEDQTSRHRQIDFSLDDEESTVPPDDSEGPLGSELTTAVDTAVL